MKISLEKIQAARQVLSKYLAPSPLIYNARLSEALGCELYLKLENMQPIGSFKIRGATYKISLLTPAEKTAGVIAASAGNHAQGVAWGSRKLGVRATIVMPENAPIVKVENTQALGAEVVLKGDGYDAAFRIAMEMAAKTGKTLIHAYEDEAVIAGQGTCGLEIVEQLPTVDVVVGSIGGGGLLSGVATAVRALKPSVQVIGCQASGAAPMARSLREGKAVSVGKPVTFADGIAVAQASESMRALLQPLLAEIVEVDDEATAAAVLMLLEKAKTLSEGSGAISLAALEQVKTPIAGKQVVVIVSGGNIDVNLLARIIDRGLIRAGRRLRINVWLSDRPGSLARLADLLARNGANVLQAIHDRSAPSVTIDQTEIELTLETRGPEHSAELVRLVQEQVIRLERLH